DRIVQVRQVGFKTMEGSVSLEGSIDSKNTNDLIVNCTGKLNGINVNQLFHQLENFGQQVITDQHLMGKLNSELELKMFMDSSLNVDSKRLKAEAFIKLDNGRLVNFEPLNNLSKFISLEELKDVRFSSLQNTIEIKNEQVFIPRMEITSSALDIFVSGKHGFDNQIDYHFQVTLSDLLSRKAKKAKKENEEFGEVADDGLGRTQLFISMTGPVDNPKISYDSRGAKEKLKTDIKEEKQVLKKILNKEFGLFKKDSTISKQDEEKKKKKKPGVIIEFDE
ncbi:MAG: AsmA-like C-terminal region-containing protein, partial [Bacteroidetes bacterium]|nr:AsmA-like C-terminal region-containing protein [Bacteroidota bacterium]